MNREPMLRIHTYIEQKHWQSKEAIINRNGVLEKSSNEIQEGKNSSGMERTQLYRTEKE